MVTCIYMGLGQELLLPNTETELNDFGWEKKREEGCKHGCIQDQKKRDVFRACSISFYFSALLSSVCCLYSADRLFSGGKQND